jgi:hypothetical protein
MDVVYDGLVMARDTENADKCLSRLRVRVRRSFKSMPSSNYQSSQLQDCWR